MMDILEFKGPELKALLRPCVYVFYQGDQCLYVGAGSSASRPLEGNHEYRQAMASADRLVIHSGFSCLRYAFIKEGKLIRTLRPALNKNKGWGVNTK